MIRLEPVTSKQETRNISKYQFRDGLSVNVGIARFITGNLGTNSVL